MGMRRDLEVHGVGGIDDALHLGVAEMLFETHRAGIENASGGHDLDDVDALGGELANYRRAFLDAGAHRRAQVCIVHRMRELGWKTGGGVGVTADYR